MNDTICVGIIILKRPKLLAKFDTLRTTYFTKSFNYDLYGKFVHQLTKNWQF